MTALTFDAGLERPVSLPGTQRSAIAWPLGGILLVLAMQATMIVTRAVNWDEFWFYFHVAEFARGDLAQPLQSLHVRLFAWLPSLGGDTIDKIALARTFMLACEAVTVAMIYAIARHFSGKVEALLCGLLYLTAGYVLQHGFSFRTDPMATTLLMGALAVLLRSRLDSKAIVGFALLTAIATMITIKVVLFAPAFAGIAWLRIAQAGDKRDVALRLAAAGFASLTFFATIYFWHAQGLTQQTSGAGMAQSAGRWMFFLGIPPYWHMAVKSVAFSPVLVAMIVLTPMILRRSDMPMAQKIALAGLWLPVITPLFYTNTAGYFYAFMFAPVAAACGPAIRLALQRYTSRQIALVATLLAVCVFMVEDRSTIDRQRAIVGNAEDILPAGIAYFDHNGMLPFLAKANYLMTPSAMEGYLSSGVASYRAEMERRAVPVLLINDETISDMLAGDDDVLLAADAEALRATYQPFWGPIRLAGTIVPAGREVSREFLVPGPYTILGGNAVIDGVEQAEGAVVGIERGIHRISAHADEIRLQWGERLSPPAQAWDEGEIYVGF